MNYVILGSSAAGINAGRELRHFDSNGEITIISKDTTVYSRCILHHHLGDVRTVEQLNFAEADYFDRFRIRFVGGEAVSKLDTDAKIITTDKGTVVGYDKLLIATGASSFIPPIEGLSGAENYVGFRNLDDIQWIKSQLPCKNIVVLGAGLVGLDCVSGLLHLGVTSTLVEQAPYPLVRQLDAKAAKAYIDAFAKEGIAQHYSIGAKKVNVENKRIVSVELSDGSVLPCDLLVITAGVRANVSFLADTGVETSRFGLVMDATGQTNVPDIYGAGDVSGLRPIWPMAVKEGIIAAHNMAGIHMEMTDFFASKSTMNFCGIPTISLGDVNAEEGCEVSVTEVGNTYKKILHKDGKITAAILQGDLAYSGILQQLVMHKIDVRHVKKPIFDIDYSDFFHMDENFEFYYEET